MSDCTSTGMDEFGFRIEAVKHLNEVASALSGEKEIERLKSENAALREDRKRLADHLEKLLRLHCLTLRCETNHPCPENIITFLPMRAAIDAVRKEQP